MQSPKVVELILSSGVRVHVMSASRYQRNALIEVAADTYPYPNKNLYEEALSEDIAIAGMVIPAEENDEYREEVQRIDALRQALITEAMLDMCVSFPDFASRDALILHFADYIAQQRRFLDTKIPKDDWQATWKFGILRSVSDESQIALVVREDMPLSEKEVNDNVRIFQPAVSWEKLRLLDFTRNASRSVQNKKIQDKPQP